MKTSARDKRVKRYCNEAADRLLGNGDQVKTTTKPKTTHLDESFPMHDATRLAEDIGKTFAVAPTVTRLTTHTGIVTDWYLVHVPTRLLVQVEDFVAGWKAGKNWGSR